MDEQTEPKKKMGRPFGTKNKVSVDQNQLASIMARLDAAEAKNVELESKMRSSKTGIETAAHRLLSKPQMGEPDPMTTQNSIVVKDQPATTEGHMIYDKCPYCIKFHAGQRTILDQTKSNKFSCRRCGKHWEKWTIEESELSGKPYPYSLALERGDKQRVERIERLAMAKSGMAVAVLDEDDEKDE